MKIQYKVLLLLLTVFLAVGIGDPAAQEETITTAGKYALKIEAASAMNFSDSRSEVYINIAQQPDLSEEDQVYLVDKLVADPGFGSDTSEVIITLLKNPAVTDFTKDMIATKLPEMNLFDSDAEEINNALMGNFNSGFSTTGGKGMEIIWTILYIACLVANCYLASQKKRNVVGWFFLGLFFFFFSTIILFFLSEKKA